MKFETWWQTSFLPMFDSYLDLPFTEVEKACHLAYDEGRKQKESELFNMMDDLK